MLAKVEFCCKTSHEPVWTRGVVSVVSVVAVVSVVSVLLLQQWVVGAIADALCQTTKGTKLAAVEMGHLLRRLRFVPGLHAHRKTFLLHQCLVFLLGLLVLGKNGLKKGDAIVIFGYFSWSAWCTTVYIC